MTLIVTSSFLFFGYCIGLGYENNQCPEGYISSLNPQSKQYIGQRKNKVKERKEVD